MCDRGHISLPVREWHYRVQIGILFVFIIFAENGFTGSASYISAQERRREIENREEDITRTKERIARLQVREQKILNELKDAEAMADKIDQLLAERAQLYYRVVRKGGGLKYLLGSSSVTDLFRRLTLLERLVKASFAERRQISLKIAEATSQLREVREENTNARAMLSMLEQALAELRFPK